MLILAQIAIAIALASSTFVAIVCVYATVRGKS